MFPRLIISWHHQLVESYILKAFNGEIKKLMVREPPRHTKSLMLSRALPAWWLGHRPTDEIICATYSDELARDHGRVVRNWVGSAQYRTLFPDVSLAVDSAASNKFNTNHGGIYVSVGYQGAITGRGANLLNVDDIYKDRQDADSPAIRKAVFDWYEAVAYSRLQPGGVQIITLTNWNDGGLDNHLIREGIKNKDPWVVVDLPALIEEGFGAVAQGDNRKMGEALWPERFPAETLKKVKINVGPKNWASMWQQKAQPDTGSIIERSWCNKRYNKFPPASWFDHVFQSWDLAFKDKDSGSYVVGQVWGKKGADFYLLDQVHERLSFVKSKQAVRDMSSKWPTALLKLVEDKANGPALQSDLQHEVPGIVMVEPEGDKANRLEGVSPLFAAGNIYLPSHELCAWIIDYVEELVRVPNAENDDQADATSQALAYWQAGQSSEDVFTAQSE